MISTRGRYALRFMMDLARNEENGPVPLEDIAARQEISKKYLEIVVKLLVGGKLVKGTSGKGGGYRLTRAPQDYTVGEILELAEGSLATIACLEKDAELCPRASACETLPMWSKFDKMVHEFFFGISLQDLLDGKA